MTNKPDNKYLKITHTYIYNLIFFLGECCFLFVYVLFHFHLAVHGGILCLFLQRTECINDTHLILLISFNISHSF